MSRTGDIIQRALDVWDKRGWTHGMLMDAKGNVCALGALNVAVYGVAVSCDEAGVYDVAEAICRYLPEEHVALFMDNLADYDTDHRTAYIRAVVAYNDWTDYGSIRGAFEKAALNEGITLK